ncbi:3-phenylpropionate/trans-cinnamate dioxygenase ferredoxin subunit [Kineosphaera limosa]|uniref:Putative dioxygenase n=1 Tax=Kineosphaera limosa NBRC 100340 TaxID=1184609 RepID=K6W5N2_9MICO|nr:non-heme iron oxygenase ferredoxin subunit [Kineosphaera limosa]NYE03143.1 3-phenylpropionate/trans-cinnamate dioxygenase ferredoxin subunit [Kineosphaera limosa]GAB94480.1 putative dioxygenase [Kineosphaera limosa NBRC 100340]
MSLPATYELVCGLEELPQVGAALAEIGGEKVAMVRTADGTVHAVQDTCTHGAVSLSEGEVEGCAIECWLHGSRFDLRTGKPLTPPATVPIRVYSVKIEGTDVYVSVAPSAAEEN